jgi:uncharacterized protein
LKIVLDTNVLVSGLINPHGPPGRALDLITSGAVQVLYDDRIISEYREVLARPRFGFDPDDVETLLDFIVSEGENVVCAPLAIALPDPDDLPFVEVAVAGEAAALVTGNTNHFVISKGNTRTRVLSPADFIVLWQKPEQGPVQE